MCSGKRGLGPGARTVLAAVVALVGLLLVAPAYAGQIVYAHGNDLWTMNDNGSNPHVLVTQTQVGGKIGFSGGGSDFGVSVQPNGTGVAFDAAVPASDGKCSANCPGLYSLLNGKLLRLSGAPADCTTITTFCGGEDIDPAVTSTGQVIYYSLFVTSTPECGIYYCGSSGGYTQQYFSRPLDGSADKTGWPTPPQNLTNANFGAYPGFEGALAADPADPTKIAYGGTYQNTYALGTPGCGTGNSGNCYPLVVESSSGSYNETGLDDSFYYGLAFSQDGSKIADIETGDNKGIWVYPSSQSYTNPAPHYTFALADPNNASLPTNSNQFDMVINGLTFVGNNELVFSANNNLWSIPASCWQTPAGTGTPTPDCGTFPGALPKGATQLTHDGTASAPDGEPAWTSSTTGIQTYSTTPCCTPPPITGNQITALKLSSSSVKSGKPLTFDVTLKNATTITIKIELYVPGKHHKKGHYKLLGTLTFRGKAGANVLKFAKVKGHKLKSGKYEALVSAGGAAHTLKFKIKR
jgi:hypothetical protein